MPRFWWRDTTIKRLSDDFMENTIASAKNKKEEAGMKFDLFF
jgi:hypothetical protein